ncbi:MAG: hypothetical protein JO112_10435 [Planctomycetes bacterium]|nr:hypothetical protein [Planctomycetota bacterium]
MKIRGRKWFQILGFGALGLLLVALGTAAVLVKKPWSKSGEEANPAHETETSSLELAGVDTIRVPMDVKDSLGIQTGLAQEAAVRPIELYGQLIPNVDRLIRIRLRFPAQVISIAQVADHSLTANGGQTIERPLRVGDKIRKGQELALVYSTDLGQKKSELVDNLSQMHLDEQVLAEYEKVQQAGGALPERRLLDQRRAVQQDRIAANKAENTLRAWQVPEDEIEELKEEAKQIEQLQQPRSKEQLDRWARMIVRAPKGWGAGGEGDVLGTLVEKNAAVDEYVDPTSSPPLFQIADLSQLTVVAYPNEEDVFRLEVLPRPIHWTIRLMAQPESKPLESVTGDPKGPTIAQIMPVSDPNQRTPILQGYVKNPGGRYLSNMGVLAAIDMPPPPHQVQIPATALIDDGQQAYVFVQPDPDRLEFTLQRVAVARRYFNMVYVRSQLTPEEQKQNAQGAGPKFLPLEAGQRVLISGALELKAALDELQTKGSGK